MPGNGLLFCGPNCVGYANITDGVGMYSAPLPRAFRKGSIGVIAQSGAVLLALGNSSREAGFSRLISSGNEAALGLADYMDYLVDDPKTAVIALFVETIRDPEGVADACRRARDAGKPVIALKVGRSELACRWRQRIPEPSPGTTGRSTPSSGAGTSSGSTRWTSCSKPPSSFRGCGGSHDLAARRHEHRFRRRNGDARGHLLRLRA